MSAPASNNLRAGGPPAGWVDREVIVLTKNGIWKADGEEITHEPTRRLFARSLKRDSNGYLIHIGRETKRIEVEDTAYFITGLLGNSQTGYRLLISDESQESLDPHTLTYKPGRLTCRIKGQQEEAKFLAVPYYEILSLLEEDATSYFLSFGSPPQAFRISLSTK